MIEFHQRKLVDGSDPTYREANDEMIESHQRQLVDGSDPTCSSKCKAELALWNAPGRFRSEAGSEQSTNCRWWNSRTRAPTLCRLDLNHPPTAVGGISTFEAKPLSAAHSFDSDAKAVPRHPSQSHRNKQVARGNITRQADVYLGQPIGTGKRSDEFYRQVETCLL